MKIEIKHRWNLSVLFSFESETATVKDAAVKAVAEGANLCDADLRGANLRGADLRGADLRDADLRGADLRDADLRGANLRGADLRGANLCDANLCGANKKVRISYSSHDMIAELLRRAAGDDVEKLQVAGLILIQRDWCWDDFLEIDHPLKRWAISVLREWVTPGDDAPKCLTAPEPIAETVNA